MAAHLALMLLFIALKDAFIPFFDELVAIGVALPLGASDNPFFIPPNLMAGAALGVDEL
jgi:hypothetical protein